MEDLLPLIWTTLRLGFRQLGLAIGPALLATIPVLFLVAWVAGGFGYQHPEPGVSVALTASPGPSSLQWQPASRIETTQTGWDISWPGGGETLELRAGDTALLTLPTAQAVPIIHKKQWWNALFGNPIGYLPETLDVDEIHIALPEQLFLSFGPGWMRGWMFTFFMTFLASSLGFKFALKID